MTFQNKQNLVLQLFTIITEILKLKIIDFLYDYNQFNSLTVFSTHQNENGIITIKIYVADDHEVMK